MTTPHNSPTTKLPPLVRSETKLDGESQSNDTSLPQPRPRLRLPPTRSISPLSSSGEDDDDYEANVVKQWAKIIPGKSFVKEAYDRRCTNGAEAIAAAAKVAQAEAEIKPTPPTPPSTPVSSDSEFILPVLQRQVAQGKNNDSSMPLRPI